MIQQYREFVPAKYNSWQEIDIITSRDCTLRCKYCYLQKHQDSVYDMDAIIKTLDDLLGSLEQDALTPDGIQGVVLSFYPEPWVNIPRTNELVLRCLEVLNKHRPFDENFMLMFGTNGVRLHEKIPVLEHMKGNLSVNVTLDGVKEQHDLYRVFPDGSPSWEIVKNNIKKFQSKYGIWTTKITLGPDTLKYIYDSMIFSFYEMDYRDVNINVVFEDLWGDRLQECLEVFDQQLEKVYNHLVETGLWKTKYFGMIGSRMIPQRQIEVLEGQPLGRFVNRPYCGAAKMRSIDSNGELYPCFRLSPYSLDGKNQYKIQSGLENTRALVSLNVFDSADEECLGCPLLEACPMCVGGAVEEADSIFYRTKHHCEFIKIQYKWALKLFNHINPETPLESLI